MTCRSRSSTRLIGKLWPVEEVCDERSGCLVSDLTGVLDAFPLEAERRRAEALAELDRAKTGLFSNLATNFARG